MMESETVNKAQLFSCRLRFSCNLSESF